MTAEQSLKIYELLGKHFKSNEDARVLVTEIEQIIELKISEKKDVLATKEDIKNLEIRIAETKVDLIKWVFAFFAAISLMIIGLYFKK